MISKRLLPSQKMCDVAIPTCVVLIGSLLLVITLIHIVQFFIHFFVHDFAIDFFGEWIIFLLNTFWIWFIVTDDKT